MFHWLRKAIFPGGTFTPSDPNFGGLMLGRMLSTSGKLVTPDSAMQLSAVWACIRLISQTIATLPLFLYRTGRDGSRDVARDHPLYTVLHDSPNADMTSPEFWGAILLHLVSRGNAFCKIVRNSAGDVISLFPLHTDLVTVRRLPDGTLLYIYKPPGGRPQEELLPADVLHLRGMSVDGIFGLSPIAAARQTLGGALSADESAAAVFANGLKASGFVQTGDGRVLTDAQRARFKNELIEFSRMENAHRTMLLEGSFAYNAISLKPEDAQLLETRQFNVEEICRWYSVQPNLIGHSSARSQPDLEEQMLHFLTFTLAPWLRHIELRVNKSLLKPADRAKLNAEFSVEGLLRANTAARAAYYASGAQNGWLLRDEIRRKENLPPVDGGDRPTVQSNLVFLDKLGETTPDQTPGGFGLPPPPQKPTNQEPVKQ